MIQANPVPRRRRWPLVLIGLLVVLGGLWAGAWGYGAGIAERTLDGWKEREAKATARSVNGRPGTRAYKGGKRR